MTAAEKKAEKQEQQDRHRRHCSTDGCDTFVTWDRMLSSKIVSSADDDAPFEWYYECSVCLAKRKNISENEAVSEIYLASASFRSSEKRNVSFKATLQTQMELMPALGATKKGLKRIRQITREAFREMWMPLMDPIVTKTGRMLIVCEA